MKKSLKAFKEFALRLIRPDRPKGQKKFEKWKYKPLKIQKDQKPSFLDKRWPAPYDHKIKKSKE